MRSDPISALSHVQPAAPEHPTQPRLQLYRVGLPEFSVEAPGWSHGFAPGVNLLLDPDGELAAQWMPLLAGCLPHMRGYMHCQGLDFPSDGARYNAQVFWHNPRQTVPRDTTTGYDWMQQCAHQWPHWDSPSWQAHVEGFALQTQLHKPLWHLSTGSLRKLWMAAALASQAPVTLIDEPTAGLDGSSLRYLAHALNTLAAHLTKTSQPARWVLIAHWECLPGVDWTERVTLPPGA